MSVHDNQSKVPVRIWMRRWKRISRWALVPGFVLVFVGLPGGLRLEGQALGDTAVVIADNPPVWGEDPTLVEELRVGTLLGGEESALGRVAGLVVTTAGVIWVGDEHLGAIRRYDRSGTPLGQVGRKGEGPGEFRFPSELRLLSDGRVAVWDSGLIRVSVFDTSGVFVDSFRPPVYGASAFGSDADDFLYLATATHAFGRASGEAVLELVRSTRGADAAARVAHHVPEEGESRRAFWLKISPDGGVLDSIQSPRPPADAMDRWGRWWSGAFSPAGYPVLAVGGLGEYELRFNRSDDSNVRIARAIGVVPWQDAEREEQERLAKLYEARGGSGGVVTDNKPPFSDFWIDSEGRFWVIVRVRGYIEEETPGEAQSRERYDGPRRRWREPFVCDVLDPHGTYLGRLRFSNRRTTLEFARGDLVWTVEQGLYNEQYVVRYRIVPKH